jgi:hypothetical protein
MGTVRSAIVEPAASRSLYGNWSSALLEAWIGDVLMIGPILRLFKNETNIVPGDPR